MGIKGDILDGYRAFQEKPFRATIWLIGISAFTAAGVVADYHYHPSEEPKAPISSEASATTVVLETEG